VNFGFFLTQTDRVWRRNSCDPNVKFAHELGVCRDIRTVTYGYRLNADNLALALPLRVQDGGGCR
jgi:hypothetical protein